MGHAEPAEEVIAPSPRRDATARKESGDDDEATVLLRNSNAGLVASAGFRRDTIAEHRPPNTSTIPDTLPSLHATKSEDRCKNMMMLHPREVPQRPPPPHHPDLTTTSRQQQKLAKMLQLMDGEVESRDGGETTGGTA